MRRFRDRDAEVETDSVREGVEEYELHDASDGGEDSLLVWSGVDNENEVSAPLFWRREESLCGCGA